MITVVFDGLCIFIAIGAAALAQRQLIIAWTLALHITISNGAALLLVATDLMNDFDPSYFAMLIMFSLAGNVVLYHYRNNKTLLPYFTILTSGILSYLVFFEYFTGSSIFYTSFSYIMYLIITAQIVLIANVGGSVGPIRRFWRPSRGVNYTADYGHSRHRID